MDYTPWILCQYTNLYRGIFRHYLDASSYTTFQAQISQNHRSGWWVLDAGSSNFLQFQMSEFWVRQASTRSFFFVFQRAFAVFFFWWVFSSPKTLRIRFWLHDVPGGTSSFRCRICLAGGSTQSAAWRLRNLVLPLATNPPTRNVSGLILGDFPEKLLPNAANVIASSQGMIQRTGVLKICNSLRNFSWPRYKMWFSRSLWIPKNAPTYSAVRIFPCKKSSFDFTSPEWKLGCPPIIRVEEWMPFYTVISVYSPGFLEDKPRTANLIASL